MTTIRKFANEIQVGDTIIFGNATHRVSEIEPYTHPSLGPTCGIAKDATGWAMTLFEGDRIEVAS